MPKKILILLFISYAYCSNAQDNIIFRNGDELKGKVLELTDELVRFKPSDNPEGPTYSYKKSELFMIKYENGKKEIFNEKQNANTPIIYSTSNVKHKFDESVFSYLVRTGWEYAHSVYSYPVYYGYPSQYSTENYSFTENNFYVDILAGTRSRHYQFGAGIGFYFQNLHWRNSYYDNTNNIQVDLQHDYEGIAVPLIISNKIYFTDKKVSPFIMGDMSWVFTNVFPIKGAYQSYNNYNHYYYSYNDNHLDFIFGAGVELKTNKKYKIQFEIGFRTKTGYNDIYKKSSFHSGLSVVF